MFLLHSLNLFNGRNLLLDGGSGDDARRNDAGPSNSAVHGEFPAGRLTSAAWEGWWHEDDA